MRTFHPKLVTDEARHPLAVQIDYSDWLEIMRLLNLKTEEKKQNNLSKYAGSISLTEDPLRYQYKIRDEWQ